MIDIERLQADKAHLIDDVINEAMAGSIPNLHDAIAYHMETGGKKLRPLLAIVTYEALGGGDVKKIIPFAAACEVLHAWCLPRDAKVITNPGRPKSVPDIRAGDVVYTFDMNKHTISRNKVLSVVETGTRDVYEIITRNRKLAATAEHPILVCERKEKVFASVNHAQLLQAFKDSGLSPRELAESLGVRDHTVLHWIYTKTSVQLDIMPELQKKLGKLEYKVSKSKKYTYSLKWKPAGMIKKGDMIVISTGFPDDGRSYRLEKTGKFKLSKAGAEALAAFKPFKKKELLAAFGLPYKKMHHILSGKCNTSIEMLEKIFSFYKIPAKKEHVNFFGLLKELKYPEETTEEFCQIAGFFLGDGFVSKNTVNFSQPAGKVREFYKNLFLHVFGRKLNENIANSCQLSCYSRPLADLFRSLDLCHNALEKHVPDWVFALPRSQKLALLRGYLDSDGTVNKNGTARFACGSKRLIEDLKLLLDSLGFPTGNVGHFRVKNVFKNSIKKESVIWFVLVSNPRKILEEIGTENEEYRKRLLITRKKHVKFYHEIPSRIIDRKFFGFNPVVSVRKRGTEDVYNLEVEDSHNFITNNVVVHNCLIHDDLEDGDLVRRDKPALWVKYGFAHGINVGDYMEYKTLDLIMKSRDVGVDTETTFKLLKAMSETALRTAEGQTLDINLRNNGNPTEAEYLDMITGKTAHYLTVPMVGAAIVANREELVPKLIEFGRALGPAFQITDDILDLTEGKGRGEIGRDIKEGKKSMLVVHCLSRCSAEEKKELLGVLNKKPEETTNEEVLRVKSLFEKHGSVEYAKRKAEEYTDEAKRVAYELPESLREILHFFADYVVKRRK